MKLKLLTVVFFVCAIAACTQKTCPTYTKDNVKEIEQVEKNA